MDWLIKGILFDIGGVLVALDGVPSLARLLGVEEDHEALHTLWMTSPAVVAHETGKIDATAFAAGVVADLRLPITGQAFLQDFCGWPTGLLPGALELLDEIPGAYRVSALSNTSAVHWNRVGAMGLADRFSQTYLSYEMGHLKPSAEAFQVAVDGMNLHPQEVLFLDDGLRNIEAAKALGMCAHMVRAPEEARSVLVQYGVLSNGGA
ncbi:MAG TPA: HAD family phosphatase [Vicinamibacterales bacterium]|nr:HAD family phosphatase [Vicinamibacterales bacterium]